MEAGEAVGDRLEGCAYGVEMVEPLPQAEVVGSSLNGVGKAVFWVGLGSDRLGSSLL